MSRLRDGKIIYYIATIILLAASIAIGPLDIFSHGYYYDEINIEEAYEDLGAPVELAKGEYEMHFSPSRKHFAGFEILLTNQPSANSGFLYLDIENESGSRLERIKVDLSKIKNETWYKTYSNADLKKNQLYTLRFSVEKNSYAVPALVTIDADYLSSETIDGNIALVYAYRESTFNFPTKVLFILILFSFWLYLTSSFYGKQNGRCLLSTAALFIFMACVLTWNYMFNSMDNTNTQFNNFQADSEALVTGPMYAELEGTGGLNGYGLGWYYNKFGSNYTNSMLPIDDENWSKGYSKTEPAIIINSNAYTRNCLIDLSEIRFENGDSFKVIGIKDDGTNIVIKLYSPRLLNPDKYGSLQNAVFINSYGIENAASSLEAYTSQFGLQGKIFRWLVRYIPSSIGGGIDKLQLLCSVATAAVFVTITLLLAVKYNFVMAGTFYFVFWLSPWVVNFARNLYWVEFTWFIPMTIGLVCSLKLDNRRWRIGCYIATFFAIVGKCLCGYEYITSVMMGLILFLMVDFIVALFVHDKKQLYLCFRTIFILGIISLIGFGVAICIHAPLKAGGNLLDGIQAIIKNDVLRRTFGADLNDWAADLWPSFNASGWSVLCTYFKFSTNIITGINGNLFPILCCIPLIIFACDYKKNKLNIELVALYIVSFFTTISWLFLAKSHSYVHTHMNYVLWYFGFIQTCLYICINKLCEIYKNVKQR